MVGAFGNVNVHLAGFCAGAAGNALALVNFHLEKRHAVQQRIERSQRTDPFAERPVNKHTCRDHRQQNAGFPGEERSESAAYALVRCRQRNSALHDSLWANILAEERVAHSKLVYNDQRKHYHKNRQYDVFQIPQRLQLSGGQLRYRDLMQKFLKPAQSAQETAEKAKVELRKENETKEVVKPQEEKAETAQENETQTGTEETDVVEEVTEAEKEREIKETLETMEAEAAVEKS